MSTKRRSKAAAAKRAAKLAARTTPTTPVPEPFRARDPVADHQLGRIRYLHEELYGRLLAAEAEIADAGGISLDGPGHTAEEPDERTARRAAALARSAAVEALRGQRKASRERMRRLADKLEEELDYRQPARGHVDQHGRQKTQSVGPDGQRRIG